MPKTKAGRLTPQIHQMKKDLEEKKDALSASERRSLLHRLKRTQRKAVRIQKEEDRQAAMAKKPEKAAATDDSATAPAPEKAEDKAVVTSEAKAEDKPEEKSEAKAEDKPEEKSEEKTESKESDADEKKPEA